MTHDPSSTNGLDATSPPWPESRVSYPLVTIDEARATATDFEQNLRNLVHERPVAAVLAAAGLGYFLARLITRGMR